MQTVIITGGNTGLGYAAAREIALHSPWKVIIACRNRDAAHAAAQRLRAETANSQVEALPLDLAALDSVRGFAQAYSANRYPPLGGILCNAGMQATSRTYTRDGYEATFGVNHLGHFLLVNLMLEHLKPPARVVFVSSGTHDPAKITGMPHPRYPGARLLAHPDLDCGAPQESPAKAGRRAYATSKLCNVLCAYEMDRRLQKRGFGGVTVNAFDPGLMPGTGLAREYSPVERVLWNYLFPVMRFFIPNVNSVNRSGLALARLMLDPGLDSVSGKYFEGFKQIPSSKDSYDLDKAADLWSVSRELASLKPEESILI